MSATRLMILGLVQWMQPVHGYDVKRELESWQADDQYVWPSLIGNMGDGALSAAVRGYVVARTSAALAAARVHAAANQLLQVDEGQRLRELRHVAEE